MNWKALILTGVTTGVAVATMVTLNIVAPISHTEEKHPQGVTVDEVFSGSVSETGSAASAFVEGASVEVAAAEGATLESEPAAEAAPAAAPEGVTAGGCQVGTAITGEPVVVKAVGVPGEGGEAAAAGETMGSDTAPVEAAVIEPAAAPEPAPAMEPEPAPVAEVAAEPAPAAAPKPRKPKAPKVAPPEAKQAWWPASKTSGKLNLTYAGEASFTKAIVLLFDGAFANADGANQHVKVTTKSGKPVQGKWLVAKGNPQMLLFNAEPGLYKVEVGEGLTDKGNRALAAASSGLVFIP